MSEKSIWAAFGRLFGRGQPTGSGSGRTGTVCKNGHPMDPSWTSCPTCKAESGAQQKTSADPASRPFSQEKASGSMSRQTTKIPGRPASADPSATRIDEGAPPARAYSPSGPARARRLTGVLATFSWDQQGVLYELYEGRNLIGKGNAKSEGGKPCDVLLDGDDTMSDEHAMILCRRGEYELYDQQSTNGTFVDGEFVRRTGVELKDGARIKTGETTWLFRKIAPASGDAPTEPAEAREPRRDGRDESRVG